MRSHRNEMHTRSESSYANASTPPKYPKPSLEKETTSLGGLSGRPPPRTRSKSESLGPAADCTLNQGERRAWPTRWSKATAYHPRDRHSIHREPRGFLWGKAEGSADRIDVARTRHAFCRDAEWGSDARGQHEGRGAREASGELPNHTRRASLPTSASTRDQMTLKRSGRRSARCGARRSSS